MQKYCWPKTSESELENGEWGVVLVKGMLLKEVIYAKHLLIF